MQNLKNTAYRWLRSSESLFKTDMVYLAKGGFWLVFEYGFQILSGIITAVAFANLLPKQDYGTYQFIMAGSVIISSFTLSGMANAITRSISQGSEGALRYGFRTQLIWSTGIALAGGATALYYYINGNDALASAFLIVGALSPFLEGFRLHKSYLIGKQLFRENATLGLWRKLLPFVSILIALYFTNNPVVLTFVYFSSNTISVGWIYFMLIRKYKLPSIPDLELKEYSKHLSILRVLTVAASSADKILLFHYLGAISVATYTLAMLPITHLQSILGLIKQLTFSKLARTKFEDIQNMLPGKIRIFFLLAVATTIIYVVAAPHIFSLLFPSYNEAVIYTQALALLILAVPRTLIIQTFLVHKMTRELYIIRVSSPAVKIILLSFLLPSYGIWGAIYALLIAELYISTLQVFLFYRLKKVQP